MTASLPSLVRHVARASRELAGDCSGAPALEFALIAPVFLAFLVVGMFFSLAVFQYVSLREGVLSGARQLAASVNDSTPYTDAVAAIEAAAPSLNTASLTITVSVNGTACATDAACSALMAGTVAAQVTGTYPCSLTAMGYTYISNCTLSSTATEMTE